MGNCVAHDIEVTGPAEHLRRLILFTKTHRSALDFACILACSDEKAAELAGVRIDNAEEELDGGIWEWQDDSIACTFDTAFRPATAVVSRLAELFPALRFRLRYGSVEERLLGELRYEDGRLKSVQHPRWISDEGEELREFLGLEEDS